MKNILLIIVKNCLLTCIPYIQIFELYIFFISQVGSYTSSGGNQGASRSSLYSRQEAEPQVAQPQRPPRNQPFSSALMPPPPAYYHQKPATRTSFPPTITINPSYRSVDPSPIPSRSESPVANSPSPPPPPEPLSLPPPMEEISVGLRKSVSPRNRSHSPEPSFPPPPSHGTLKRMTSYKRWVFSNFPKF